MKGRDAAGKADVLRIEVQVLFATCGPGPRTVDCVAMEATEWNGTDVAVGAPMVLTCAWPSGGTVGAAVTRTLAEWAANSTVVLMTIDPETGRTELSNGDAHAVFDLEEVTCWPHAH